jgi:hypothetical protein
MVKDGGLCFSAAFHLSLVNICLVPLHPTLLNFLRTCYQFNQTLPVVQKPLATSNASKILIVFWKKFAWSLQIRRAHVQMDRPNGA